ncbi:MAG: hypothetical protein IT385_23605 [Deltaproteobacteria bacterium]|nr:hypothetical protein [Deltaproteobacteria bacterium]
MRRLAFPLIALVALASSSPALAADPTQRGPVRSQFYIFDTQTFEAGPRGPGFELMRPHVEARFARMLSLKKDLLPGIGHARKDPVFK